MKIVADAHIPFIKEYFGAYGELILKPGRGISAQDVKDADILIVRSITHVDKALLEHSTVKFVGSVTAGADHLDTKWLEQAGIQWSVATGFNAPPVADYVVSVVAAMQKKQLLAQHKVKAAVIGVGNVGRLVVERLRCLGFDIVLSDPIRALREPGFISTPLEDLHDLDFISLHVPLSITGEHPTYHFIERGFLQQQKPGCVLLNASRGAVIASKDLLQQGAHLHWCLDVWEHEPNINKTLLQQAAIATPHIAGYSVESKIRGIDMIYRIACERNVLTPHTMTTIVMPQQTLEYSGDQHEWQDIVLGVFNPEIITTMMQGVLLPADPVGEHFDAMRNQFNFRHEFKFTEVKDAHISVMQRTLLEQLGLKIVS